MSRRSVVAWVAAMLALAALTAAPAPGAAKPVPQGFVGVVVDEPTWPNPDVSLPSQLDTMVSSGVESVRAVFDWSSAQPYRTWREVPPSMRKQFKSVGGVPTDFRSTDELVADAAERRLTVLPVIENAPRWDGQFFRNAFTVIPRSPGPYAAFAGALVRRYGPAGSFWRANPNLPRIPIRMWQIWNEPNLSVYWPPQPYYSRYLTLLRLAHDAIKAADRGAKIVLAGLTNYSWIEIVRISRFRGADKLFDVVAVHPYTRTPQGVITILGYVRQALRRTGQNGKPVLADEISWPSSQGQTNSEGYDFTTTEYGQAANVREVVPLLARNRARLGLAAFYYYDWAGQDRVNYFPFDFAGLLHFTDGQFQAKPALDAFQSAALSLEGCRTKAGTATSCNH